jgi:two-component system, chemotaxis family, sensor kinase Cph1
VTESDLERKVEELARSNRELEHFALVDSHDLREPLRMVGSYTHLLAERYRGKLDHDADRYIDYACDGALRMQGLVRDLLALSCVGRDSGERQSIDCNLVVEEVVGSLDLAIRESNGLIHHEPLPSVFAHRAYLMQLFQNLIENAIKFRGKEAPIVSLLAEPVGQEWLFSVTDNGLGIPPEHFEDIFGVFCRLQPHSHSSGNGTGLAMCKKIVEHYGGRIWVESKTGYGSSFKFTLPADPQPGPEA